jgi:serine/threonine-protein kinase
MSLPPLIADRYQPLSFAGRGAFAEVYRGVDTATGEVVALKRTRLTHQDRRDGRRREVAVMRALRLPGVVRLRDVVIDGRDEVLVMDWVEGAAFPGAAGPMDWDRLRPLVLSLVETLRGVHAVGLRHNDLKPDNVLVDRTTGRVTMLDFNLAAEEPDDRTGGTMLTMAPEVLLGGASSPASDLYSLGVVIAWGLLGDWPPNEHIALALSGQLAGPLRLTGVHPEAAAWVEALTQPDPARRRAPELTDALLDAALSALQARASTLEALFVGHQAVHHLPEDAARALVERAGTDPAAQRAELTAWVRRGDAWLHEEGVEVHRAALQRLADPPELRAALVRGQAAEVIQVAEARAQTLAEVGRLADACQFLLLALEWRAPEEGVIPAVEALVIYSLAQEQPVPIREARRALQRLRGVSPLTRLLEAYQSALEGDLTYAEGLAQSLPPFESDAIEIWRVDRKSVV